MSKNKSFIDKMSYFELILYAGLFFSVLGSTIYNLIGIITKLEGLVLYYVVFLFICTFISAFFIPFRLFLIAWNQERNIT